MFKFLPSCASLKQNGSGFPGDVLTEQKNLEVHKVELFYLRLFLLRWEFPPELSEWLAATRPSFLRPGVLEGSSADLSGETRVALLRMGPAPAESGTPVSIESPSLRPELNQAQLFIPKRQVFARHFLPS